MSQLLELEPVLVRQLSARKSSSRSAARPSRRERDPEPVGLLEAPVLETASAATATLDLDAPLVNPLRRPEARPLPKRQPAILKPRPGLMKAAVVAVSSVALLCFAGRVTAFAMAPVVASWQTGAKIQQAKGQLEKQKALNEALKRDIDHLNTPLGREEEARRRGWTGQHEIGLAFVLPESASVASKADLAVKTPVAKKSIATQIRETVDTCLENLGGVKQKK